MKTSGFTLLEVIIYCALFSLLMTSSIVTVYALTGSSDRTAADIRLVAESTFVNQKLAWVFFGATDVKLIDSKTIKIIRPDLGLGSPLIVSAIGGGLYLAQGLTSPLRLTGDQFNVVPGAFSVIGNRVLIEYTINDIALRFETYTH